MNKQETLEEASEEWIKGFGGLSNSEQSFIAGAKWQAEKMYSVEEVRAIVWESRHFFHRYKFTPFNRIREEFGFWFEQFKKK